MSNPTEGMSATPAPTYRVEVKKSWSYVIGNPMPEFSGPWRYEWEAQEYADELNAVRNAADTSRLPETR